jgi:hypothetical protein
MPYLSHDMKSSRPSRGGPFYAVAPASTQKPIAVQPGRQDCRLSDFLQRGEAYGLRPTGRQGGRGSTRNGAPRAAPPSAAAQTGGGRSRRCRPAQHMAMCRGSSGGAPEHGALAGAAFDEILAAHSRRDRHRLSAELGTPHQAVGRAGDRRSASSSTVGGEEAEWAPGVAVDRRWMAVGMSGWPWPSVDTAAPRRRHRYRY